jgi:hypothetical protein
VDSDRINNFGYCFEQSQDIDQDIDHAIWDDPRIASFSEPDGMDDFGECLEYDKDIDQNFLPAVQYDHFSI